MFELPSAPWQYGAIDPYDRLTCKHNMAGKAAQKGSQKEKGKIGLKDALDLRDEILDLKREISALRKERDKLIIRLRKSEDESKRKDKQIEQLMDPSQNSEIRRLLSMKGAALLLNLKEQNNTLVQLLMEKNQQIKRMGSEIKTAKLYSRTNKTEPYRLEISRLRNLLLQSQEALKEAAHGPHVTSACLSGHSGSSSDEMSRSPQELEELRFMVHSLETHMEYSKELLGKKNLEIANLSRELENLAVGFEGQHCRRLSSPHWNVGQCSSRVLNYEGARRCTSATLPLLESFQQVSSEKTSSETSQLTVDKRPQTQKILNFGKSPDQVASEDLIQAEKELGELEAKVVSENLERNEDVKGDKEPLQGAVTGKPKSRNCDRKKTSSGKEKWKCAVQKLRSSDKNKEKDFASMEKAARKVHTNPNANDEEVWSVLNPEALKKGLSEQPPTPKPSARKLSLPVVLTNKSIKNPSKPDEVPDPAGRKKIEEPSEIITELELTPRGDETDHNSNTKLPILYRPSIDSSIDSENGSRLEVKLFEVEAEINGFASISSLSESPIEEGKDGGDNGVKKTGGETGFGGGNVFCFENGEGGDSEDEDDDEDVITI